MSHKLCFHFPAVPEGSGRFPEDLPEACSWGISFPAVPEGSGWLPEVVPEAFSACVPVHTVKTCCNLERKLMSLWTLDAALEPQFVQVEFPEGFRKATGSFPEAYMAFVASSPLRGVWPTTSCWPQVGLTSCELVCTSCPQVSPTSCATSRVAKTCSSGRFRKVSGSCTGS